jgi:transcription termination/antitermination protein NusG
VSETSDRAAWYAVWTRSRHEKMVQDRLARRGFEPFLPLWSRWSQWKDRRKLIATPLFPQYCFVRFHPAQKLHVLKTPGVLSILGTSGVIEPVREAELEAIQTLVNGPLRYDPCPFLEEGMEVEVVRGPLRGVQGRLVRKNRSARLVIAVTLIRQGASVEIDAADVIAV